jgi:membrane protease YdiL (CAAX protease family)
MNFLGKLAKTPAPIRILIFFGCVAAWWVCVHLLLVSMWGNNQTITNISMVILYLGFVGLLWVWGRRLYLQFNPLRYYGWDFRQPGWRELLSGWSMGSGLVIALFTLQAGMGWLSWQPIPANFLQLMGEGLLVAVAVGCAEELLFRGWLLQELERDYSLPWALGVNSTIFACLHYLKPLHVILQTWTQFVGLVILGASLVWCRRLCQGRLVLAIGLHGGLVWGYYLVRVGALTQSTQRVPEWVTGINGNPLAGALGLSVMTALAGTLLWLRQQQLRQQKLYPHELRQ